MSFREKIAWAACLSTVLLWGGYLTAVFVAAARGHDHPGLNFFWWFIALLVAQVAVMATVGIASAILSPRDANAPLDERDRLIAGRAGLIAYRILLVGNFAVIAALHGWIDGIMTIFVLFGLIAAAEAIRYAAQIIGYRTAS